MCPNGICPEWNTSLLFKRINGTSNGTTQGTGNRDSANTEIFADSEYYDYLKSGDSINGTKDDKGSKWYQLIADHEWVYGDISSSEMENAYDTYLIETGQTEFTNYVQNSEDPTTVEEQTDYRWTNKITAKVGLMYIHDYLYASPIEFQINDKNLTNLWIHFSQNGYNKVDQETSEWLLPRHGLYSSLFEFQNGLFGFALSNPYYVRPVFYLSSGVKIKEGTDGTKTNPYILDVQE